MYLLLLFRKTTRFSRNRRSPEGFVWMCLCPEGVCLEGSFVRGGYVRGVMSGSLHTYITKYRCVGLMTPYVSFGYKLPASESVTQRCDKTSAVSLYWPFRETERISLSEKPHDFPEIAPCFGSSRMSEHLERRHEHLDQNQTKSVT